MEKVKKHGMLSLGKNFLKETSVHGLRYVVEGSNFVEKTLWMWIISAAFATAGIMVANNLRDLKENPIAVSIDTIPVKNLPFPAVTMNAAILEHPYRLVEDVYNDIQFDCHSEFQKDNETCQQKCMDNTEKIRQDLLPLTEIMLERQQLNYDHECRSHLQDKAFNPVEFEILRNRAINEICSPYLDPSQIVGAQVMHPCMDNKTRPYIYEFFDHLEESIEIIAETLRIPNCLLNSTIQAFHHGCNSFGTFDECHEAIMSLNDDKDDLCYISSILETILPILKWPFRAGVILKSSWRENKETSHNAESLIGLLIDQSRMDISNKCLLELLKSDLSQNCTEEIDMEQLIGNMDLVYKLFRLIVAPTSKVANEKSELADAGKLREFLHYVHHYSMRNEDIFNEYATISACKFGSMPLSSECQLFSNVFSTSGIGYNFNSVPYWTMFRNNVFNYDFYKEMYERKETIDKVLPRYIKNTGQNFALDFIIKHSPYGYKCNCVTTYDQYQKVFLSLHDPSAVPNLKSDGLLIQPGFFYDIRVKPSETITDASGLALDRETRNCLSRDENEGLNTYNIYSQSACIFECKVQEAVNQCNCSSWDYPRLDPLAKLCLNTEERNCFTAVIEADDRKYDCDCLDDCQYYTYDIDVNVTELQPRNNEALLKISEEFAFLKFLNGHSDPVNGCNQNYLRELSRVRISVQTRMATVTTRSARVSFSSQLANLGGIVGLFTGMSILSLAESLYWVVKYIKHAFSSESNLQN